MSKKYAVITGASRGIGRGIALLLAEYEYNLILTSRDENKLAESADLCREKNSSIDVFQKTADMSDISAIDNFIDFVEQAAPRLDILVNNAGFSRYAPASKAALQDWEEMMAVNLRAPFYLTGKLFNYMLAKNDDAGGKIINIVSKAGVVPFEWSNIYNQTKFGLLGYTKSLSLEAKKQGIQVSAICPGSVATDFQKNNPLGTDWMLQVSDVVNVVEMILKSPNRVQFEEIVFAPVRKKS